MIMPGERGPGLVHDIGLAAGTGWNMKKSGHVILLGVLMLAGTVICPRGIGRKNKGKL